MRRVIFWDAMLFIHLLDSSPAMRDRIGKVFQESLERNDRLITSCLAIAEVLAGAKTPERRALLDQAIGSLGFELLPFQESCIPVFGMLRSQGVAVADAIHLACAATFGSDLFLTEDRALQRRHVSGIKFIAGIESAFHV